MIEIGTPGVKCNPYDPKEKKNQEQHDAKIARLLARLQDEVNQSGEKDGCCTDG